MTLYWQHYYDTLWQALTTIIIHGICSLILLILLINTIYHFFLKSRNMNPYRQQHHRKPTRSIEHNTIFGRTNVMEDMSTTSGSRPSIPSLTYISSNSYSKSSKSSKSTRKPSSKPSKLTTPSKPVEIVLSIKILTMLYLILIFIFSLVSFIMRLLMIFYHYKIECLIREHSIEIALLGRICLFIIFVYRLYFSFRESSFAYPTYLLIIFTMIGFIITNSTLIYFFMQITINRDDATFSCTKPSFSTTKAILPYFLCEFTFNAILVFLFCRKLIKSLKMLLLFSGGEIRMNFQVLQTIQLMAKMTLSMTMIFISTLLILGIMTSYLSSACISLDNVINVICMLLVFKHNERYYKKCCCGCNRVCIQLCLCCYIKGIHINQPQKMQKMEKIKPEKNKIINMNINNKMRLDVISEQQCDNKEDEEDKEENEEEYEIEEIEEFDFTENDDDDNFAISYDSYIDTLTIIFLNDDNMTTKLEESPVPVFVDQIGTFVGES